MCKLKGRFFYEIDIYQFKFNYSYTQGVAKIKTTPS